MSLMNLASSRSWNLGSGRILRLATSLRRGMWDRSLGGALRAVLAAALLAAGDAHGVERAADDVVAHARQVLHAAAADHHHRVLLQVVAHARDVAGDLHPVGEPHARHLAQRRVRLLGSGGVDAGAHAALLRAAGHRGRLALVDHLLAPLADELADRRHQCLSTHDPPREMPLGRPGNWRTPWPWRAEGRAMIAASRVVSSQSRATSCEAPRSTFLYVSRRVPGILRPQVKSRLTLLDCLGIGINGIIGSGIFLLPARVFAHAGGLAWASWFAVGWVAFASVVLSYGAVARALGRNLSYIVPSLSAPLAQGALAAGVVAALALLNWRGVKPGAVASDVLSGAKLLPLLGFVAVGLFFVAPQRLAVPPPDGASTWTALRLGGLAGLFACTGFEYVPVPAGETDNPRRNVPLALLGALFGAMLLYALVEVVFIGTHPDPAHADKPLAEAAAAFAGPWAARLLTVGAAVSSFGFCTGVALVGPRYLSALADDGLLPAALGRRHPRFATPGVAIVATAAITAALVLWADFDRLSDLGNVAVFAQYLSTCLAVPVLRWLRPDLPRRFRLPFGVLVPAAATAGCLLFLKDMNRDDLRFALVTLACGLLLFALLRLSRRPVPGRAP